MILVRPFLAFVVLFSTSCAPNTSGMAAHCLVTNEDAIREGAAALNAYFEDMRSGKGLSVIADGENRLYPHSFDGLKAEDLVYERKLENISSAKPTFVYHFTKEPQWEFFVTLDEFCRAHIGFQHLRS